MLGELMNIPTDTLIDMLYIILAGDFAITATDADGNRTNSTRVAT